MPGDGDTDVLSASFAGDKIAWYESNGRSPPSFTERVISTTADGARSVFAADLDGDGDIDVLSASGGDVKIAWYENRPPPSCLAASTPGTPTVVDDVTPGTGQVAGIPALPGTAFCNQL